MKLNAFTPGVLVACMGMVLWSNSGCAKKERKEPAGLAKTKTDREASGKHDGWWCQEHGVPEYLCSLCSDAVEAKCKKEGDWCKLHDRAQSQCFKCDPSKYKKFEDMYVVKYNKKPEPPPEEEFRK